jgi:cyclopropane fatty-acyl-phospholipid synthase-like methyltransferase/Zn ribbon nucleic-acid-binding protein
MATVATGTGIDIAALQPPDAKREMVRRQRLDAMRRTDPGTGLLRRELSVLTNCYVCGSQESRVLFVKEGFRFVECVHCGLVYVNPRLNDEETARMYSEDGRGAYYFEHFFLPSAAYRMEKFYPKRLDAIEKCLGRKGRLLDVGCGSGHFLLAARRRGWEVHGVELAEYAVRYARERLGLDFVQLADVLDADYEPASFDAVTLWDVVEHVTNPRDLMRRVRELLVPGGMAFIYTPTADCFERRILGSDMVSFVGDFHPAYHTRNSLRRLVEEAGLTVADLHTFGLDIAHIVDVYEEQGRPGEVAALKAHADEFQRIIDKADEGCYLACYVRRGR